MRNLSWREKLALRAFDELAVLRYCDLPVGIGEKTMRALIAKGLSELVDPNIGEYAKGRCWRRTRKHR
jgi:hypothetical protein